MTGRLSTVVKPPGSKFRTKFSADPGYGQLVPRKGRRSSLHRRDPDPASKRVGARIRAFRLAKGISFDAFVEECEVGRGYISELERGLVNPSLRVLEKVADVLEVTTADLVAGDSVRERLFEAAVDLDEDEIRRLIEEVAARRGGKRSS
jgi:transcriptional regulator with XRE-family HTH domain